MVFLFSFSNLIWILYKVFINFTIFYSRSGFRLAVHKLFRIFITFKNSFSFNFTDTFWPVTVSETLLVWNARCGFWSSVWTFFSIFVFRLVNKLFHRKSNRTNVHSVCQCVEISKEMAADFPISFVGLLTFMLETLKSRLNQVLISNCKNCF